MQSDLRKIEKLGNKVTMITMR